MSIGMIATATRCFDNKQCFATTSEPDNQNGKHRAAGCADDWNGKHHPLSWPALFINAAAPLLVPLTAPNPSSVVRMHGYALLPRNPLQTNALRNLHGDS